jgi:Ni/Co efflux regulator RcnB
MTMKKLIISTLALAFFTATSLVAQDDKKQEPKKNEAKKEESKQEPSSGGTRMAINEKGLPGKKKNTSTAKTTEEKKEEPKK